MKSLLLAVFTLLSLCTDAQYKNAPQATDDTYGYKPSNPLRMKKGDAAKSIKYTQSFLGALQTVSGEPLILINRVSLLDPHYNPDHITNKIKTRWGKPISGDGGMLDKYTFITTPGNDTITIYVSIYRRSKLYVPVGLKMKEGR